MQTRLFSARTLLSKKTRNSCHMPVWHSDENQSFQSGQKETHAQYHSPKAYFKRKVTLRFTLYSVTFPSLTMTS